MAFSTIDMSLLEIANPRIWGIGDLLLGVVEAI